MSYASQGNLPAGSPASDREMSSPQHPVPPCPGGCGALEPEDCRCCEFCGWWPCACAYKTDDPIVGTMREIHAKIVSDPELRESLAIVAGTAEDIRQRVAAGEVFIAPRKPRPCSICGAAPCESPSACRSQARAENEPPDDYEETDCDG